MKKPAGPYSSAYFRHFGRGESGASQRNRSRLQALRARCPQGSLLEIGCGMGAFLGLAQGYFSVEGMDISAYAAGAASQRLGVPVQQADLQTAALPRDQYDAVAAYNVLEHLARPLPVLEKIYGSLRPGGWLAGSVPNNFGLLGGVHTALTNLFDRTHVSTFPPGRWQALFRQAGFSQVVLFGELLAGPNRSLHVRGPLWRYFSFNLMFLCKK